MMKKQTDWNILSKTNPKNSNELLKVLLSNRNIQKKNEKLFLHPIDPSTFTPKKVGIDPKEMKKAVERIKKAKEHKEKVLIFGDYDADGICATAILWEALYAFGVDVVPFIPHREKHGYGLSNKALNEILTHHIDLLITVDNGIVAHEPFKRLKEKGVSTILTDHHLKDERVPECDILIHTTKLCGATVSWMLAKEVDKKSSEDSLDLCAIATIADQVPLLDENRSFAKHGLEALKVTKRPGLLKLMDMAGIDKDQIDTYTINYGIAPRLNAMGRLKHAMDALRLICTRSVEKAELLAQNTQDTNENRQELTYHALDAARKQKDMWKDQHLIVISGKDFHDGVIGLIAGKIMEEFHKPTIVINENGDASKASARSVPGVNIIELIRKVKHLLIEAGGHPMAAGFSIESKNILTFTKEIQELAKREIPPQMLLKVYEVECILSPALVTLETVEALKMLEPYGMGNPKPVFGILGEKLEQIYAMGQDGKHIKLLLTDEQTNTRIKCIGFGMGKIIEKFEKGISLNVSGYLQKNVWKDKTEVQFVLKSVHP